MFLMSKRRASGFRLTWRKAHDTRSCDRRRHGRQDHSRRARNGDGTFFGGQEERVFTSRGNRSITRQLTFITFFIIRRLQDPIGRPNAQVLDTSFDRLEPGLQVKTDGQFLLVVLAFNLSTDDTGTLGLAPMDVPVLLKPRPIPCEEVQMHGVSP